jgi:polysaccharide biosynthesis protein PslJ
MRPALRRVVMWLAVATLAVVAVVLVLATGGLSVTRPLYALVLAVVVLAFGLTLMDSAIVPLAMLLPLLVVLRLSVGGADLSVSDFALFVAFWPAVVFAPRPYSEALRSLLWLTVVYQAATFLTVVANPYAANAVEWVHAWFLTGGALVVGWSIGRGGHARVGLTLLLLGALVIAVSTIVQGLVQYAGGDFAAVYPSFPFAMHKNFAGCVLGIAAITAYTRPVWVGWSRAFALSAFWVCAAGIVLTQSRQALVALGVGLVVVSLRTDPDRRRSKLILLAVAPALGAVAVLVKNQVETGNEFNSVSQRLNWFADSVKVWEHNYLFGVGLRWWYTDRFPVQFQPPNAEAEVLSSAGLVGLVAFLVLMLGALRVLWRVDAAYGVLASVVVLSRLVQGQLDLFWVGIQVSVPFVIAGVCLGAKALAEAGAPHPLAVRGGNSSTPRPTPPPLQSDRAEPDAEASIVRSSP